MRKKRLLCLSVILVLHYYTRKLFYHFNLINSKLISELVSSSEINFEFIKFVKGKMYPFDKNKYGLLYKYYVPWLDDSRKYHHEECDYHISRDDIFDYHLIRECNIYFIIPNIRSFIFYRLSPTVVRGVPKGKWCTASYLYACMKKTSFTKMALLRSLNARTDHDVRSNKLRHKKSTTPNLTPSSVI